MNTTKFSIIIPVYKAEKLLRNSLDSIINQTFKDFELILIDDGSPDNSGRICDEYAKNDSRIKVFHKENSGAGNARNVGIKNATGEYIWFIDADDFILKDALKIINSSLESNPNSDILIFEAGALQNGKIKHDYLKVYNLNKKEILENRDSKEHLENSYKTATTLVWNKCFRRSFVNDNNIHYQNIKSCNDHYFTLLSLTLANKISYIDEELYYYNTGSEFAISRTRGKTSLCTIEAGKYLKQKLKELNLYNKYKVNLYRFYMISIEYQYTLSNQRKELLKASKEFLPFSFYMKFYIKVRFIKLKYKILYMFSIGKSKEMYKQKYDNAKRKY